MGDCVRAIPLKYTDIKLLALCLKQQLVDGDSCRFELKNWKFEKNIVHYDLFNMLATFSHLYAFLVHDIALKKYANYQIVFMPQV